MPFEPLLKELTDRMQSLESQSFLMFTRMVKLTCLRLGLGSFRLLRMVSRLSEADTFRRIE